jgi:hypothetical protein
LQRSEYSKRSGRSSQSRELETAWFRQAGFPAGLSVVLGSLLWLCFVLSAVAQSSPTLVIGVPGAGPVQLTLSADVGSPCTVQYAEMLSTTNAQWLPLTNSTLLTGSAQFFDTGASNSSARFYRAVILVPTNMVWVQAGSFAMGSPTNEAQRSSNETRHNVTLTKGFFVGKYLVTQASYLSLLQTNPSYFTTNHGFAADLSRPVEQTSPSTSVIFLFG